MQMETRTIDERPTRRWTRREFEALYETGVLDDDDRLELIEGELFVVSPEGPPHSAAQAEALIALQAAFGKEFSVRFGHPMVIGKYSLPQPDLLVVPGRPGDYRKAHPGPEQAILCAEVSQSSRNFDLGRKLQLYARAGIREYWVIDLVEECILVHRRPSRSGYKLVQRFTRGTKIQPLRAKGPAVDVTAILG